MGQESQVDGNPGTAPLSVPRLTHDPMETKAAQVARSLLELVFTGSITPGERLPPERQLAEAFGVGRSAVREGLKSLNLLGLVEIRQGDGTYVKQPDSDLLPRFIAWGLLLGERRTIEAVEARQSIEVAIARLAAERRDEQALARLSARLSDMEAAVGDPERFVNADVNFHLEIARTANNRVLLDVLTSLQSLLHSWIDRVIRNAEDPQVNYEEHIPILEAIERGDADAAAAAMWDHLHTAGEALLEALEETVQGMGSDESEPLDAHTVE